MNTNIMNRNNLRSESRKTRAKRKKIRKNIILSFICFALTLAFFLSLQSMNASAENVSNNDYKYFTVVKVEIGDTLTSIAKEYYDENHYDNLNDFLKEIKYSNHINNTNSIKEGQSIVVPYYSPEYHS